MKKDNELYIIDEEDGWLLLEEKTINDRTLVCWFNPNTKDINLIITHLTDRPNELSKRSPETTWGWITYMIGGMHECDEAAKIVTLYLQDMENDNHWWEKQ